MAKVHDLNTNIQESRWTVSQESLVGDKHISWKEMSTLEKVEHLTCIFLKLMLLMGIIFVFICTLALLADAFKLIGGKGIGNTIKGSKFIQNPISASIIGMVITLILQSSSTLISLLVAMVAGGMITVHQAIPIMLGSEMGASFMNALISLGQSGNRDQFRRAFAAATMNDVYNLLSYLAILPVEIAFGIIEWMSSVLVGPLATHRNEANFRTLSVLTDPILKRIIQIDSEAINNVAALPANVTIESERETFVNRCIDIGTKETLVFCPYEHFFAHSLWSDGTIGLMLLCMSVFSLIGCLIGIVHLMQSLLAGHVAVLVRRLVDQECPSPFRWLTDYVVMFVGCAIVMVVQSSGVFRSALTPLVGIGVITLERLYALLLGANVGTTFTGVLAALSADPLKLRQTMQIALCQTIYNLLGIVLFYPVPFMRSIPLSLAMKLGDTTAKYRWFALVYIITIFFLIPATLLALSFLPSRVMISIVCVFVFFFGLIGLINLLQVKFPSALPKGLRNWEFLPRHLHSLRPYDKGMSYCCGLVPCFRGRFVNSTEEKGGGKTVAETLEISKHVKFHTTPQDEAKVSARTTEKIASLIRRNENLANNGNYVRKLSKQTEV